MSRRVACSNCGTGFVIASDHLGTTISCPKCGAQQPVPPSTPAEAASATDSPGSVFLPAEPPPAPRRRRRLVVPLVALGLLLVVALGVVLVSWPALRRNTKRVPPNPIEAIAYGYLTALSRNDEEGIRRLGTLTDPPAIDSFSSSSVKEDAPSRRLVAGSFAPLGKLHAKIDEEYVFDAEINRFQPRNPLGAATETLDTLHDAKAKAEQEEMYEKMASADLDEVVDAVTQYGGIFARLSETILTPRKLVPTYEHLVEDADPALPEECLTLASDVADDDENWEGFLGRPFHTLKADGPFRYETAIVTTRVRDRLASSGDPPSLLRLTLTRFQLEGIDTGWKVTEAKRVTKPEDWDSPRDPSIPTEAPDSADRYAREAE